VDRGPYVIAGRDLDRYHRLGSELQAVAAKLQAADAGEEDDDQVADVDAVHWQTAPELASVTEPAPLGTGALIDHWLNSGSAHTRDAYRRDLEHLAALLGLSQRSTPHLRAGPRQRARAGLAQRHARRRPQHGTPASGPVSTASAPGRHRGRRE
jgi:hypothetical protein